MFTSIILKVIDNERVSNYEVDSQTGYITIEPVGTYKDGIDLKAGSYVIEKRLWYGKASFDVVDDIKEASLSQLEPIANLIISWLDDVKCEKAVACLVQLTSQHQYKILIQKG